MNDSITVFPLIQFLLCCPRVDLGQITNFLLCTMIGSFEEVSTHSHPEEINPDKFVHCVVVCLLVCHNHSCLSSFGLI